MFCDGLHGLSVEGGLGDGREPVEGARVQEQEGRSGGWVGEEARQARGRAGLEEPHGLDAREQSEGPSHLGRS